MSVESDTKKVKAKVTNIFAQRQSQVFALAQFYAAKTLSFFQANQLRSENGRWWTNQTYQASQRVFTNAFIDGKAIGYFIAHGIEYGIYLTLANNRAHDALTPCIFRFFKEFKRDLGRLYRG
jgi:hypothetical protein